MKRIRGQWLFLIFLFVVIANVGLSQSLTDSLRQALTKTGNDTARVRTLTRLSWALRVSDPEEAMKQAQKAQELAIALRDEQGEADSWNNIGVILYRRGDLVHASAAHIKALSIRDRIGDKKGMALSYVNLGNIYSDQKNNATALNYYKQAAALLNALHEPHGQAAIFLNIGAIYIDQKKYGQALDFFAEARARARAEGKRDLEAQALNNQGVVQEKLGQIDEAMDSYNQAFSIHESLGDKIGMADEAVNVGSLFLKKKNPAEAMVWLKQAESLSLEMDYSEGLQTVYQSMSDVYRDTKDFEKAYQYSTRSTKIHDSIYNEENLMQMNELTARYETERNERELMEKAQLAQARADSESQTRNRFKYLLIGAVLVCLFALLIVYAYLQKKRSGELLEREKKSTELINVELARKNKDVTDSLLYSQRIQQALLPSARKLRAILPEAFVFYQPKDIVSGDFYWLEQWGAKKVVVLGDCTGHGVPGALLSVVGINQLNQAVQAYGIVHPAALLQALCKGIAQMFGQENDPSSNVNDGMDVAVIALDSDSNQVQFSGANRSLWLWRDGQVTCYRGDRRPVSPQACEELQSFTSHEISVRKGDVIYVFTDGYADQFGGADGKKYKVARLLSLLQGMGHLPMDEQRAVVVQEFERWRGGREQVDDILVMGFRV